MVVENLTAPKRIYCMRYRGGVLSIAKSIGYTQSAERHFGEHRALLGVKLSDQFVCVSTERLVVTAVQFKKWF